MVVTASGQPVPVPVTVGDTDETMANPALRERYEGMRVHFVGLTAVAPTGGRVDDEANATVLSNGRFTAVSAGMARPFREPGIEAGVAPPPGAPDGIPVFDGNPERWLVDPGALSGVPLEVPAGTVFQNAVGPIWQTDGDRFMLLDVSAATITYPAGVAPVPEAGEAEFTVAGLNLQRFYDTTDDEPGYDVPMSPTAYAARMNKASLAIRDVLRMPDVLGVAEVENLSILQALADRINADAVAAGQPNPEYLPLLIEGNDVGLIDVGFLVKQAMVGAVPRVSVLEVAQIGKDSTFDYLGQTYILNDRPSLALKARVADPRGGEGYPLTIIVNHLRSLSGIETDQRVRLKRFLQAEELALEIQHRQTMLGERIVLVGDFNAFQFSDGYVDVMGTISGRPTGDPVVISGPDRVNPDLTNLLTEAPPEQQYSYVFEGSAQQIDHVLVTESLLPRVSRYTVARFDADFPLSYCADGSRPERLSDHDAPIAYLSFPASDVKVRQTQSPNPVRSGRSITYWVIVENGSGDPAYGLSMRSVLPAGTTLGTYTTPDGWSCGPTAEGLSCEAPSMGGVSSATITIEAQVPCDAVNGAQLLHVVDVDSAMYNPIPGNNHSEIAATVDNPPPAITGAVASPAVLWPVNHEMVPIRIDYSASDNCEAVAVCSLTVTSSETTDGRGDGHTATDWQVIDARSVLLRSERSGTGNGRTYTVTIACTDGAGGTSRQRVTIAVPKSRR